MLSRAALFRIEGKVSSVAEWVAGVKAKKVVSSSAQGNLRD